MGNQVPKPYLLVFSGLLALMAVAGTPAFAQSFGSGNPGAILQQEMQRYTQPEFYNPSSITQDDLLAPESKQDDEVFITKEGVKGRLQPPLVLERQPASDGEGEESVPVLKLDKRRAPTLLNERSELLRVEPVSEPEEPLPTELGKTLSKSGRIQASSPEGEAVEKLTPLDTLTP